MFTIEECCEDLLRTTSDATFLFLEGASEPVQQSFFDKVIEKVTKLKEAVVAWVQNFYEKHFTKEVTKKIEDELKSNPSLQSKKVKIHDYKKMESLQDEVCRGIEKYEYRKDVEVRMKKYRKQRNLILAGSALITVGLGTAFAILTKKKNQQIVHLEKTTNKLNRSIESYKDTIREKDKVIAGKDETISGLKRKYRKILDKKNSELDYLRAKSPAERTAVKLNAAKNNAKHAMQDISAKVSAPKLENLDAQKAKASAFSEIVSDIAADTKANLSELASVVTNKDKSTFGKVVSAAGVVGKQISDTKTAITTDSRQRQKQKNIDNADRIEQLSNFLKNGKAAYKKLPDGEKKTNLKKRLKRASKELKKLQLQ